MLSAWPHVCLLSDLIGCYRLAIGQYRHYRTVCQSIGLSDYRAFASFIGPIGELIGPIGKLIGHTIGHTIGTLSDGIGIIGLCINLLDYRAFAS